MPETIACTLDVTTDGKTRTLTLDDKVVTFGRSRKNTVPLREDGKVSSQHCQVVRQKDSWMLIDNGSKNKTFLNGSAVSVAALKHGDTFKIGETSVTFKVGAPQALDPKDAEKLLIGAKPTSNQVAGDAIASALAQPAPEPRAARKSSGVRDAVRIERGSKGVSMTAMACFFVAGIISGVTLLYSIDGRDNGKKVVAKVEEKAKGLVQDVKDVVKPTADELKIAAAQNSAAEIKTRMEDLRKVIEKSSDKETVLKALTDLRASLAASKEIDQVRGEFDELKKTVQSMNGDVAWLKGEFDALRKTYFTQEDVAVAPKDKPVVPADAPKDPPVVAVKETPKDPPVVTPPVDAPKPPADEPVTVKKEPTPPPAVGEEPDPVKPPSDPKDVKVDPGSGTVSEPVDDPNRPPTQFMGMQTKLRHVIFVMDVTGSMEDPATVTPAEFSGPPEVKIGAELKRTLDKFDRKDVKTKLDAAKYELSHSIAYLHPDVEFTVIFYSFSPVPWQKRFMQASDKNKIDAIKRIKTTSAWGGTNIYDALECGFQIVDDAKKAMKKPDPKATKPGEKAKPEFAIFLVTDGKHNTGRFQNDPDEFLKEIRKVNADDRVLINTIGVGQPGVGVDPPDPVFLARLASENGGESKMVK